MTDLVKCRVRVMFVGERDEDLREKISECAKERREMRP